jgi:hypothetical protein
MLIMMLQRDGLETMKPNDLLREVLTFDKYDQDVDEKEEEKKKKTVTISLSMSIKDRSLLGLWSSHRFIIPSTYLFMGAGRLVTLLLWAPALSGSTDWRRG